MTKLEEIARVLYARDDCKFGYEAYGDKYELNARAAVEALRVPSEAMKRASRDMHPGNADTIGSEWAEMIDAILNEKPE